ncbi:hypothetical protein WA026_015685 [Henosepilachna vigintioctopunctata]|uniref:Protein kinase domain-containing protein n=1 Tax=Henosepilachna vigintioctopunctata TaxID=420089 RepID=A0AAW1USQ0_9CUCU
MSLLHCLPMTRVDLMAVYIVACCVIHSICILREDEILVITIPEPNEENNGNIPREIRCYVWPLDDFELGYKLGRGKFGRVFLAREKRTGYLVAMKTLLKREIVKEHVETQTLREIEIQSRLK